MFLLRFGFFDNEYLGWLYLFIFLSLSLSHTPFFEININFLDYNIYL